MPTPSGDWGNFSLVDLDGNLTYPMLTTAMGGSAKDLSGKGNRGNAQKQVRQRLDRALLAPQAPCLCSVPAARPCGCPQADAPTACACLEPSRRKARAEPGVGVQVFGYLLGPAVQAAASKYQECPLPPQVSHLCVLSVTTRSPVVPAFTGRIDCPPCMRCMHGSDHA